MLSALLLSSALSLSAAQATDDLTPEALGGAAYSPFTAPVSAGIAGPRVIKLNLNLPGQTWQEEVCVAVPPTIVPPMPVLTLFHGYGERPEDVLTNTPLVRAAVQRGWLVVIPMGAHIYNYGIDYAQDNIEGVYEFLAQLVPLDMDRMYAVGFSMGGGAATSYAARHLDPNHVRFAAVVNHTGSTSLRHTYQLSNDFNLFESPLMFGGSPSAQEFRYLRSSTTDLDAVSGAPSFTSDLSRNLLHIDVQNWSATNDPVPYLIEQTDLLQLSLERRGAAPERHQVASSLHTWGTLDAQAVLDWLEPKRLTVPGADQVVPTIADRDGAWHHFTVTQTAAGAFTPFTWMSQTANNRLFVIDAENLDALEVDANDLELDTTAPIDVVLHARDASQPSVTLTGFAFAPTSITRNGVASSAWTWDAARGAVTIHEPNAAQWGAWRIAP